MAATVEDVRERWSDRDITIYKSKNGWFAITSRLLQNSVSKGVLNADKARGYIPSDSICSSGRSYVQRVSRIAADTDQKNDIWSAANLYAMTRSDKRFVQLGLAFQGHYNGLLDGDWGRQSQAALERYSASEYSSGPENWHLAALAFDTFSLIERDGWKMHHNTWLDMSYLFPFDAAFEGTESAEFMNWEHSKSTLKFSFSRSTQAKATQLHQYVLEADRSGNQPYSVRKTNFAVSSARLGNQTILYARSRYVKGLWSTVMVSAHLRDEPLFKAVTASISDGYAPPLRVQSGGYLDRQITETVAFVERENQRKAQAQAAPDVISQPVPEEHEGDGISSGTGFVVAASGSVLTNAHVVKDCKSISINGLPAKVRDSSDTFDLALLDVSTDKEMAFASFSNLPANLNSDITVVGYPLNGILGGLNVTRGAVSSMKGLAGDVTKMQITAPVQPGNSGGPVIDGSGRIVGVVVSKLNAARVADLTGDIPQNINFAIRGEIAKLFLFQNGLEPNQAEASPPLSPVMLAKRASEFTVLITCQ